MRAGNSAAGLAGSTGQKVVLGIDTVLRFIAAGGDGKRNDGKQSEWDFP
jgi:hypothetical protein